MFLGINSTKVTYKEYVYEANWLTAPLVLAIAWVTKLLRIRLPGSTDIPPVESLIPFACSGEQIGSELHQSVHEAGRRLEENGFVYASAFWINALDSNTRYGQLLYLSPDRTTIAWVRDRRWPQLERRSRFARIALFTLGSGGDVVMTTSANRDLLDPDAWKVQYHERCDTRELISHHSDHVLECLGASQSVTVHDSQDAIELLDLLHKQLVEFQVSRGVFTRIAPHPPVELPASLTPTPNTLPSTTVVQSDTIVDDAQPLIAQVVDADQDSVADYPLAPTTHQAPSSELAGNSLPTTAGQTAFDDLQPVIDEVRRIENKQTKWMTRIVLLGVSVAAFVWLGAARWDLTLVWLLLPILFVHELGHLVAMKCFGYRNINMFFIPLLGAAVTGRHYHVAGWKKAMVSLAGPLPSILIGSGLALASIWYDSETLLFAATMTLVINVFNLLPVLPLDGGWVAHVTLFVRSPVLDMVFRVATLCILALISLLLGDRLLIGVAIAMGIGLPLVWKTRCATEAARKHDVPEPIDDQIPDQAIRLIAGLVQQANVPANNVKQLASMTVNVYEAAMTRPPSWPATVGIWMLHGGGVLLALVAGLSVMLAGVFKDLGDESYLETQTNFVTIPLEKGQFQLGTESAPDVEMLLWEMETTQQATEAFDLYAPTSHHTVARVGNVILAGAVAKENRVEPLDDVFDHVGRQTAIEKSLRNDERLAMIPGAVRQRVTSYNDCNPRLLIAFEHPDQADALIERASRGLPVLGEFYPISITCPRITLTDQQRDLQQQLRFLCGHTDGAPWMKDIDAVDPPDLNSFDDFSSKKMQKWLKAQNERSEKIEQARKSWIENERAEATGIKRELFQAHQQFEQAKTKFSERQTEIQQLPPAERITARKENQFPELNEFLMPMASRLGYIDSSSPDYRFTGILNAYLYEPNDFGLEQSSTQTGLEGSIVEVSVYSSQDLAAAFSGLIAWAKRNNATGIELVYDSTVLEESDSDSSL